MASCVKRPGWARPAEWDGRREEAEVGSQGHMFERVFAARLGEFGFGMRARHGIGA